MALTVADAAERAALDALLNTLDSGTFVLLTAADVVLATLGLAANAFGSATTVGGAASADSGTISPDSSPTAGTIGKFQLRNNLAVAQLSGSVSVSSGDLLVTDNEIPAEAVEVTCTGGLTITLALS
jgi:hypothetical protein